MKCIEDEIPFELPDGWCWARLKHICMMAAGKAKSSDQIKSEPFDGCYPCFGGNGIRGYVNEYNQEGTFSIVGRQGALVAISILPLVSSMPLNMLWLQLCLME